MERYMITVERMERIGWMSAIRKQTQEYAKTKADLKILVECINEDVSITRAFFTDRSNGSIVHFKANGEPIPVNSMNLT